MATVGGETEARKSGLDQDRDGRSRIVAINRVEVVTNSLFFSVVGGLWRSQVRKE